MAKKVRLIGVGLRRERTGAGAAVQKELAAVAREARMMGGETRGAEKAIEDIFGAFGRWGAAAGKLWKTLGDYGPVVAGLAAITLAVTLLFGAVEAGLASSARFEVGLVGVGKTANLEGERLQEFGDDIDLLSRRLEANTETLNETAQAAGQLGVTGEPALRAYTETITKFLSATDFTSGEDAATALAKIQNVAGEAPEDVEKLASSMVALGNNFASTESKIAHTTVQVSLAAASFSLASSESAAIATTLSAFGVQAELAGSSTGRAFRLIERAVQSGGQELAAVARVARVSSDELIEAWEDKPLDAFNLLLQGLKQAGGNITAELASIGVRSNEDLKVLPVLAKQYDSLAKAQAIAAKETRDATALDTEAAKARGTLSAQSAILGNQVDSLLRIVGDEYMPIAKDVVRSAQSWAEGNRDTVTSIAEMAGTLTGSALPALKLMIQTVDLLISGLVDLVDKLTLTQYLRNLETEIDGISKASREWAKVEEDVATAIESSSRRAIETQIARLDKMQVARLAAFAEINKEIERARHELANSPTDRRGEFLGGELDRLQGARGDLGVKIGEDGAEKVTAYADALGRLRTALDALGAEEQAEEQQILTLKFIEARDAILAETAALEARIIAAEKGPEVLAATNRELEVSSRLSRINKDALRGHRAEFERWLQIQVQARQQLADTKAIDALDRQLAAQERLLVASQAGAAEYNRVKVAEDDATKARQASAGALEENRDAIESYVHALAAMSREIQANNKITAAQRVVDDLAQMRAAQEGYGKSVAAVSASQEIANIVHAETAGLLEEEAAKLRKVILERERLAGLTESGANLQQLEAEIAHLERLGAVRRGNFATDAAYRAALEEIALQREVDIALLDVQVRMERALEAVRQNSTLTAAERAAKEAEVVSQFGREAEAAERLIRRGSELDQQRADDEGRMETTIEQWDRLGSALAEALSLVDENLGGLVQGLADAAVAWGEYADAKKRGDQAGMDAADSALNQATGQAAASVIGFAIADGAAGGGTSQFGGERAGNMMAEGAQVGAMFGAWGAFIGGVVGAMFKTSPDKLRITVEEAQGQAQAVINRADGGLQKIAGEIASTIDTFFGLIEDALAIDLDVDKSGFEISIEGDLVTIAANGYKQVFRDLDEALAWGAGQVLAANADAEDIGENMRQLFDRLGGLDGVGSLERLAAAVELAELADNGLSISYKNLTRQRREEMLMARELGLVLADVAQITTDRFTQLRGDIAESAGGILGASSVVKSVQEVVDSMVAYNEALDHEAEDRVRRAAQIAAEIEEIEASQAAGVGGGGGSTLTLEQFRELRHEAAASGLAMEDWLSSLGATTREAYLNAQALEGLREELAALEDSAGDLPDSFDTQQIADLWEKAAAQSGTTLVQMIRSIRGEGALAEEEAELRRLDTILTLAAQIASVQTLLAVTDALSAATRGLLEGIVAEGEEVLAGLEEGRYEIPNSARRAGRGNRRQERESLREMFEELRAGLDLAGPAAELIRFREETADLASEMRRLGLGDLVEEFRQLRQVREEILAQRSVVDLETAVAQLTGNETRLAELADRRRLLDIAATELQINALEAAGVLSSLDAERLRGDLGDLAESIRNGEAAASEAARAHESLRAEIEEFAGVGSALSIFREAERAAEDLRRRAVEAFEDPAAELDRIELGRSRASVEAAIELASELEAIGVSVAPETLERFNAALFEHQRLTLLASLADEEFAETLAGLGVDVGALAEEVAGMSYESWQAAQAQEGLTAQLEEMTRRGVSPALSALRAHLLTLENVTAQVGETMESEADRAAALALIEADRRAAQATAVDGILREIEALGIELPIDEAQEWARIQWEIARAQALVALSSLEMQKAFEELGVSIGPLIKAVMEAEFDAGGGAPPEREVTFAGRRSRAELEEAERRRTGGGGSSGGGISDLDRLREELDRAGRLTNADDFERREAEINERWDEFIGRLSEAGGTLEDVSKAERARAEELEALQDELERQQAQRAAELAGLRDQLRSAEESLGGFELDVELERITARWDDFVLRLEAAGGTAAEVARAEEVAARERVQAIERAAEESRRAVEQYLAPLEALEKDLLGGGESSLNARAAVELAQERLDAARLSGDTSAYADAARELLDRQEALSGGGARLAVLEAGILRDLGDLKAAAPIAEPVANAAAPQLFAPPPFPIPPPPPTQEGATPTSAPQSQEAAAHMGRLVAALEKLTAERAKKPDDHQLMAAVIALTTQVAQLAARVDQLVSRMEDAA